MSHHTSHTTEDRVGCINFLLVQLGKEINDVVEAHASSVDKIRSLNGLDTERSLKERLRDIVTIKKVIALIKCS